MMGPRTALVTVARWVVCSECAKAAMMAVSKAALMGERLAAAKAALMVDWWGGVLVDTMVLLAVGRLGNQTVG